jgi:hypothetical protein
MRVVGSDFRSQNPGKLKLSFQVDNLGAIALLQRSHDDIVGFSGFNDERRWIWVVNARDPGNLK